MKSILHVFIPFFLVYAEFNAARSTYNLRGRVDRYSFGVIRGVVQVVQNWFTGIPNPSEVRG